MKKHERVCCEIDLSAIQHNLEGMHSLTGGDARIIAVVKADAYGHGAEKVARFVEEIPWIWGFAVASAEEALHLKAADIRKPVLILGYVFPEHYGELVRDEIRTVVFKEDMARALSEEAVRQNKTAFLHLGVDTGMGRIGVSPDSSSLPLVKKMAGLPNVRMEGIFTHFSKADMANPSFTEVQLERFGSYIGLLKDHGIAFELRHCANSAGIYRNYGTDYDLVRAGISMYGLPPSEEMELPVSLEPALALKSHIVYIKEAAPGTEISYGGTWTARRPSKIATIPVGYGDGYPRNLSGKGCVLIRGKRAPICGRVCMDQFMADVTDIPDVAEYDEVTLIGKDGEDEISMMEIARLSGGFHYEIPCCISGRVPRVYR